ncbi:RING-H2 finger protein ATL1D, partial [Trichinella spiralis]|uniref:RING-H2 finger protein ATL1D n=1 Tax=Trichinella spiralis TaxID=6334 RepID=UPI0001EFD413
PNIFASLLSASLLPLMLNTTANKSELSSSSANSTSVSPFIIILACFSFIATVSNLTLMYLILKRKRPNKLEKISFGKTLDKINVSIRYCKTPIKMLIKGAVLLHTV